MTLSDLLQRSTEAAEKAADQQLRALALQMASKHHSHPDDVMKATERYYDFLKGAPATPAPTATAAPPPPDVKRPITPDAKTQDAINRDACGGMSIGISTPLWQVPASSFETCDLVAELQRRGMKVRRSDYSDNDILMEGRRRGYTYYRSVDFTF